MKNISGIISKDPLIKNSMFMITSNVLSLIIGFFFWIIVARYYAPDDIGNASVILSGAALISMISTLGFPTSLVYYLPRDPKNANRMINSCIIICVTISIVLSLIWMLNADIWAPKLKPYIGIIYIAVFIILSATETISSLMSSIFVAGSRSFYHMVKETVLNVVKIIPIFILSCFCTIGILLSWSIGLILSIAIGFILTCKLWNYKPIFAVDNIVKDMFGLSFGNYIAGIISYIPRSILPILIMNLVSAEAAGYFFIAMTVASVINTAPQFIARSLLAESHKKHELWNNVNKAIRFSIFIIVPGLLGFLIFGKFVLKIFNPTYAENALCTLLILSLTSIPLLMNNIFITVRNSQKRIMSVVYNNLGVAIITIGLSIPLIKTMGINGAALSFFIANSFVALTVILRMENRIEFASKLYKEFILDFNLILKRPMKQ